jgi:hypothetical protein
VDLRDVGWVWEGQGIDPGVPPSIYGLGQGTRYFGLSRAIFLFHRTDAHALRLMSDLDEVACSMLRYGWAWDEGGRPKLTAAGDPDTLRDEGAHIARLSKQFTNITGVFCDDLLGVLRKNGWGPDRLPDVVAPMREANPGLRLWSVVYTHEFEETDFWALVRPNIDVVNLWVWESRNLKHLPRYVDDCRRLFPDKPINMGVYLRDYPERAPVPVDAVKRQMALTADYLEKGKLDGFSVLGTITIETQRAQAEAIREFIAAG